MVRGGRGKKGCLSQRHAHKLRENNNRHGTRRAWAQLCIARLAWRASRSKYCTALRARPFSFLPSFLPHLLPCLSHTFLFATHDACSIHQQAALHTKAAPRHQKKTMGVVVSLALSSPAAALTPVNRLSALNSNALLRSP